MTATGHAEHIRLLADHFRPYGWTERSVDGYLIAVGDLDLDLVRRAVVVAIRTCDKLPSGAELRRIALGLVAERPPAVDDAWAEVRTAFGRIGRNGTPRWSHPLIGRAVESCGGWWRLCESSDGIGDRIAFVRSYSTHLQRAEQAALMSPALADVAALVRDSTRLPGPHTLPPPPFDCADR